MILGFLFMSKTHFDREKTHKLFGEASEYIEYSDEESFVSIDAKSVDSKTPLQLPKPYTFAQRLRPCTPNPNFNLLRLLKRQVVFLACPAVLWTIIFYGLATVSDRCTSAFPSPPSSLTHPGTGPKTKRD
jgi:hypothetical protein